MDDEELVARVAAGDDVALRELFGRHAPWLAARLRSVLAAADVEDVLQETFLAVWKFLRRRGPATLLLPAVIEADGRHASDPAEAALSRAQITEAVIALGPEGSPDRDVWQLMYVEDRPVAEVARLMGIPEGTVKSRAHRARRLLRAALGGRPAAEGGPR
jgi:RNA polymerase sigma-70 factor (ECF subfamily)